MHLLPSRFLLLLVIAAIALTSCKKFLDVQPEDRFLDTQVYSSQLSIRNVLNGIYLKLAKPALYGENLSSTTVDVLAQYYPCAESSHPFYKTATYGYQDASVMKLTTAIWDSAYTAVLNINLFIHNLEDNNTVLKEAEKRLLLGEAYGLRAYVLFDLLRLFGPVYANNAAKAAIPYPVAPAPEIKTLLSATVAADNALKDLTTAASLLEKDPVRTNGAKAAGIGSDAYFSLRNRRMNYFAVKALTARILLYKGDKAGALTAATSLISELASWFPWSAPALSLPGIPNPDRVFSGEVIFGLENANMYNTYISYFAASKTSNILAPVPQVLENIYEHFSNDYRYRTNFSVDATSNRTEKTFFKYADIKEKNLPFRKLQPLIRLSELYYIAIECETDNGRANTLLNTVRLNRGLPAITISGDKKALLTKEYQKEFWGEGQLFFYYKRINEQTIESGKGPGNAITMTANEYVVPLPLSETTFR